ncbi:uncharacterized protein C8A04DRAFT_25773 [Dichotomopilus funicola]|uniref:HMG box domain-containing protein n=1 Tax=Dichotomopilus funicola TaxID=1934379 RepID=A0AAN6V7K3_9PEZI|nr:hypothetical protein C8A04DRAFT_25773 [Dichotomopilus funicola]
MAPASAVVPPALPPSVEEAYRRKCIQLRQRTNEVEEANDAARLRLARLKRQVLKMRLERAFLLEQLAKRSSTNVEDSDGSPSPPPTPKEKPLRIKRGHRKPSAFPANVDAPSSVNAATPGSTTFISQNLLVHSPSSDAFSAAQQGEGSKSNGLHKGAPKKPGTAFELYCDDNRESAKEKAKEGDNVEDELSNAWKELPDKERDEYQSRADNQLAEYEKDKEAYDEAKAKAQEAATAAAETVLKADDRDDKADSTESDRPAVETGDREASRQQEDVEMTNYDTDQETQGEKPEE